MQLKRVVNRFLASLLYRKQLKLTMDSPIVTFSFDDFPASAMQGAKLLEKYNKKGTFYISCGLMNKTIDNILQFREKDIEKLILGQHELGCHTYHHLNVNEVTSNDYENSIIKNKQFIQENFAIEVNSFSYPFGGVNPSIKNICSNYYTSGRSVMPGINQNTIDINLLKANRLYSNSISLEHCKTLIDINNKNKGWLIFYTHDISDNPSPYGCTLDYFEKVLDYANNSSKILTINESLEYINYK